MLASFVVTFSVPDVVDFQYLRRPVREFWCNSADRDSVLLQVITAIEVRFATEIRNSLV